MEFTNLMYCGIDMGACGKFDIEFMRVAGIKWTWLEAVIKSGCYQQARLEEERNET